VKSRTKAALASAATPSLTSRAVRVLLQNKRLSPPNGASLGSRGIFAPQSRSRTSAPASLPSGKEFRPRTTLPPVPGAVFDGREIRLEDMQHGARPPLRRGPCRRNSGTEAAVAATAPARTSTSRFRVRDPARANGRAGRPASAASIGPLGEQRVGASDREAGSPVLIIRRGISVEPGSQARTRLWALSARSTLGESKPPRGTPRERVTVQG